MFKIDPSDLSVVDTIDLIDVVFGSYNFEADRNHIEGPREIVGVGDIIYGIYNDPSFASDAWGYNTNTNTVYEINSANTNGYVKQGIFYDSDNGVIWITAFNGAEAYYDDGFGSSFSTINLGGYSGGGNITPRSLVYVNGYVYFAVAEQGTLTPRYIAKKAYDDSGFTSTIDLGDDNALPYNIRLNPYDGKIYVPALRNNKVYTIDPNNSDALATCSGSYDSPYDMVFTPSTVWAIQHGLVGIVEVPT